MSGCRIGKIKPKSGGEIYRLPVTDRDDIQRRLLKSANTLAGQYEPGEMRGYVTFGWDERGYYSVGYMINGDGVIGVTLLPSFIADALRRELIEHGEWQS